MVTERRLRLAGHILRLPETRPSRAAIHWIPEDGRCRRGRPKNTWRSTFIADLRSRGVNFEEACDLAKDRDKWRSLVALCPDGLRR